MTNAAFAQGWWDGALLGEQTLRQAMDRYPSYSAGDIDAYCQGTIDGATGDRWRLDGKGNLK